MEILKIALVIIFNIIAFILMVLCFTQTKQETGISDAVMGAGKDSFYEKNKNRTSEGRMDNIIRILFVFLVLLAITRMVSLTAMVTITLGVFLSLLFNDWTLTLFALAINIFIIYRHRSNIQRILNGTENKVPMPWEQKNKDTK